MAKNTWKKQKGNHGGKIFNFSRNFMMKMIQIMIFCYTAISKLSGKQLYAGSALIGYYENASYCLMLVSD